MLQNHNEHHLHLNNLKLVQLASYNFRCSRRSELSMFINCDWCFFILVFEADVKTARASEDVAIFLASFTYSGCIHNWQELLHIINQHLVEQSLIPFLITNKKQTNKPSRHEKSPNITCLEVHWHLLVANKAELDLSWV